MREVLQRLHDGGVGVPEPSCARLLCTNLHSDVRRADSYGQAVQAHELAHSSVGDGVPVHDAPQAPLPHATCAPSQLSAAHAIEHGPVPHSSVMSPQASGPSQEIAHPYCAGHSIVELSQPSTPVQTISHE